MGVERDVPSYGPHEPDVKKTHACQCGGMGATRSAGGEGRRKRLLGRGGCGEEREAEPVRLRIRSGPEADPEASAFDANARRCGRSWRPGSRPREGAEIQEWRLSSLNQTFRRARVASPTLLRSPARERTWRQWGTPLVGGDDPSRPRRHVPRRRLDSQKSSQASRSAPADRRPVRFTWIARSDVNEPGTIGPRRCDGRPEDPRHCPPAEPT